MSTDYFLGVATKSYKIFVKSKMTDESETFPVIVNTQEVHVPVENNNPNDNRVNCWVCFGSTEDDKDAEWVQPCKCRGTTKWVHQTCLQRWIDEKQKGNSSATVTCPQCNAEYILVFPPFGRLVFVLDMADRIIYKVCPLVTAGIVVGSIYWTAVTYGAVTVMQILGHKEGLNSMEQADPLVLLVGLPTIPVMLVLGKMIRWEDYLLRLWRRYWSKLPNFSKLLGRATDINNANTADRPPPDIPAFNDPISATRVLCGALLLPTMATVFGRVFFAHISQNPQRTLLGGITFIVMKGVLKMYLRQQQYVRQCQRKILNYDKSSVSPQSPTHSQSSQTDCTATTSSGSSSASDF
ncbi:e3 ubiquitin-protein ligase MARCHF5 [Trichonephila inaurata madagascariensis]|uniref:E3 ubiquitin-protein ligase MARCHF5 n=1 Tax=Trichonephila inaurata madagascariensis TaxID=2747483 RepID=A0A8X7C1Q8_9ARAC|nr:e3 ubiquitin-protein ligase MARCHF5 [Trichonephila inaurata madagascariensis]